MPLTHRLTASRGLMALVPYSTEQYVCCLMCEKSTSSEPGGALQPIAKPAVTTQWPRLPGDQSLHFRRWTSAPHPRPHLVWWGAQLQCGVGTSSLLAITHRPFENKQTNTNTQVCFFLSDETHCTTLILQMFSVENDLVPGNHNSGEGLLPLLLISMVNSLEKQVLWCGVIICCQLDWVYVWVRLSL